jgi:hypothetical protein
MSMRIKAMLWGICVSGTMTLFAIPSIAAESHACVAAEPTAASYTWDFHKEANAIFQNVEEDARKAMDHAANLQSYEDSNLDWVTYGEQLNRVRAEVNDMGDLLCRLETIRPAVAPWQQKTIDSIASSVRLMADNAQDAIVFGNSHSRELWVPTFQAYVNNLYSEAESLTHSTGTAVEYSHVQKEYLQLRKDLGVSSAS